MVLLLLDLSDNEINSRAAEQISMVLADETPGERASSQILGLVKNNIETQAGQALLAATTIVIDFAQNPVSPAVFTEAAVRQAAALVYITGQPGSDMHVRVLVAWQPPRLHCHQIRCNHSPASAIGLNMFVAVHTSVSTCNRMSASCHGTNNAQRHEFV